MKRAALGSFLVLAVLLVGGAPGAMAHTELILSTPADGAVLSSVPEQVVLTFSEDLIPDTVKVSAVDGSGLAILIADPVVDGSDVTALWPAGLVGPDYSVNYRVVSQDGHPVEGTISFTAGPAAPASSAAPVPAQTSAAVPASSTTTSDDPGSAVVPYIAIAAGLAIGVVVGIVLVRRRRGSTSP